MLPMHTVARSTKYHLNYAPAGFGRGQHTSLALPLPLSPFPLSILLPLPLPLASSALRFSDSTLSCLTRVLKYVCNGGKARYNNERRR